MTNLTQEVIDRLEFYDGGDGVEYELWLDTKTKTIYKIPLEINRLFNEAENYDKL